VLNRQALPAARRSIDALTAAYSTGNASLLEWVDMARSVTDVELEAVALAGEISHGVAALERAVGAPLPRTPLEPPVTP
jgi:outer membrane protein TolC